jgi:hypothetical protein
MYTLEDLDLYDDAVATYRQLDLSATDEEADARVHPTDYLVIGA